MSDRLAMENLLLAAKILYAHAYNGVSWDAGRDLADEELPGWLADCKADIEAGHRSLSAQHGEPE